MSTVNKALRIVIALVLVVAMIGSNCVFADVTSGTIDEVAFKDAIFKFGDLVFIDDDTTVLDMTMPARRAFLQRQRRSAFT